MHFGQAGLQAGGGRKCALIGLCALHMGATDCSAEAHDIGRDPTLFGETPGAARKSCCLRVGDVEGAFSGPAGRSQTVTDSALS